MSLVFLNLPYETSFTPEESFNVGGVNVNQYFKDLWTHRENQSNATIYFVIGNNSDYWHVYFIYGDNTPSGISADFYTQSRNVLDGREDYTESVFVGGADVFWLYRVETSSLPLTSGPAVMYTPEEKTAAAAATGEAPFILFSYMEGTLFA